MIEDLKSRVRGGERQFGRGAVIHFKWRNQTDRFVGNAIVCETNALSEARPVEIIVRRQKSHGAIPKSPP